TPIGGMDMLIAAQAIAQGFTLITHNVKEFARVPDLKCETWVG
ncbi:type II toxin-antitoxin system VapC family toxin, partial [Desulfovibrio sp. OH1186_COT-070]